MAIFEFSNFIQISRAKFTFRAVTRERFVRFAQTKFFCVQEIQPVILSMHNPRLTFFIFFTKNAHIRKWAWPFRHVYQYSEFRQFVIMITKHHIELIQVSNSLDLKMATGFQWGPRVYIIIYYYYHYITGGWTTKYR